MTMVTLTELISVVVGVAKFILIPCITVSMLFKIPGFNEVFEKIFRLNVED